MTIHHDKFAYGKLESLDEEISQEQLKKMVSDVNEASGNDADEEKDAAEPKGDE